MIPNRDEVYSALQHQEGLLQNYRSFLFVFVSVVVTAKVAVYPLIITFGNSYWSGSTYSVLLDPRFQISGMGLLATLALLGLVRSMSKTISLRGETVALLETLILIDEFGELKRLGEIYGMLDQGGKLRVQAILRFMSREQTLSYMGPDFRGNMISFMSKVSEFRYEGAGKTRSVLKKLIFDWVLTFLYIIMFVDCFIIVRELFRCGVFS